MKSLLFFVAVVVLGLIAYTYTPKAEGFQSGAADPGLNVPAAGPLPSSVQEGEPKPFAPPSDELLAPPPGQLASVTTLPFEDPAQEKVPASRILGLYTDLKGFMDNEAGPLSTLGDPAVQLPLSTARSDLSRLKDEQAVLARNPGLQSTITQEDADGIEANLGYLQKKWRMSANRFGAESPMPPSYLEEGFDGSYGSGGRGWISWLFGSWAQEGFQSSPPTGSGTVAPTPPTLEDLQSLSTRIGAEIIRLNSSGTTDPLIAERTNTYTLIQKTVDDYIAEIKKDESYIKNIKISKEDINRVMKVMAGPAGGPSATLAEVTATPELQNLFEVSSEGDKDAAKKINELLNKYAEDFLKNLSWSASFSYKGEAEKEIARNYASAMADAKMLGGMNLAAGETAGVPGAGSAAPAGVANGAYRGLFDSVVRNMSGMQPVDVKATADGVPTAAMSSSREGKSSGPAGFNWKPRAVQICQQAAARGLDPKEFGCLENPDKVSDGFSWRGYTRMVCTRLGTNYDPGVPEACGCPPFSWEGWRA